MSEVFKVENLSKSYQKGDKGIQVLKGLNLRIEQGMFLSITGASGAGKSTLLHVLGLLDKPDEGILQFQGVSVEQYSDEERARIRNREIGFVFQFHYLLPEFSARENVMIPSLIAGTDRNKAQEMADNLLFLVGLGERGEHKPSELSGGEQQRVAIARALINQPAVLLMDEPTGNLDTGTGKQVFEIIKKLQEKQNQTIILVTHNEELAEQSHRVLKLKEGQLSDGSFH